MSERCLVFRDITATYRGMLEILRTNVLLLLNTLIHNTVGEVDEIGCERKSPGAGNCCKRALADDG